MARTAGLLVLAVLCGLLVVGSSGFTAATVARPVGFDVVDDDDAYLSYDTGCDDGAFVATVTNRFEATELRVSAATNSTSQTAVLAPSGEARFQFDDLHAGEIVVVRGTARGGGLAIQYARDVALSCSATGR